jgi:transaldolase
MKIYLDSAKLDEIKCAMQCGVIDGVTTNPTLLRIAVKEERRKLESHIREICKTVGGGKHVSLEVLSQRADKMVREARIIYEKFNPIAGNVVIKIPINTYTEGSSVTHFHGLTAIKELSERGIPVNATLVMTPEQAILGAKAGATYVSPFTGRIDDYIRKNLGIKFQKYDYFNFELAKEIAWQKLNRHLKESDEGVPVLYSSKVVEETIEAGSNAGIWSGVEVVKKTVDIFKKYGIGAKVIAASMRHPRQVREVAEAGADIVTIPFDVLQATLKHFKTEEGVRRFCVDAREAGYEELFG